MLKVIPDNNSKTRYLVDSYAPINDGAGVVLHLNTDDFTVNKQIELDNVSIDLVDQLAAFHSVDTLSVVLDENTKERITVESYRPIGNDQTELKFTKFAKADANKVRVIDLPVEAVDMISAKGSIIGEKLGAAIDLSSDDQIDLIRMDYESGEMALLTGNAGMPLNVSPDGVDVILQQAQRTSAESGYSGLLKRLGLRNSFTHKAAEKPMTISAPVSLADVDAHIESKNQDNDAVATAEL